MEISEQVAVIYCGVRGYIDKIDPSKVTEFEKAFMSHLMSNHADIIADIKTTGMLTDETDAKLKDVVIAFVDAY